MMKQHEDKDLTKVLQDCEALVRELRTKLKDKCDEVLTLMIEDCPVFARYLFLNDL